MGTDKIVIANAYRCKSKQTFFALHQIHSKIKSYKPDVDIEFHILWDDNPDVSMKNLKKWEKLIDNYGFNIVSYDKQFFVDYTKTAYDIDEEQMKSALDVFFPLYHILLPHYLRRVKMYDYYLIYDDDILINYDFRDVINAILEKKPVLLSEPFNPNCDKALGQKFTDILGESFIEAYLQKNPNKYGFNAGFQGIDLRMYDSFLSKAGFVSMLNLFDYRPIFDADGNAVVHGNERMQLETQQQSFFGLLNVVMSKNDLYILDPSTTYVAPNFGYSDLHGEIDPNDGLNGWSICLKSKIAHFIGLTEGRGKPKEFLSKVDEYLTQEGFL